MLFKERSTNIFIKRVSKVIVKVFEPLFKFLGRKGVLDGHLEQVDEPLKGILIHWVDA
jgi:hypothetical protein